jgi:uncharacterized repeat protein (TIGR03803 family)
MNKAGGKTMNQRGVTVLGWALVFGLALVTPAALLAQEVRFQIVKSFGLADGYNSEAGLIKGADGALYGTTVQGGLFGKGTVFKVNEDGNGYAVLHHFGANADDGASPYASLLKGADGALYGTTFAGGPNNTGTVFKLNEDGSEYSVLYRFWSPRAFWPYAGLLQAADGALYGVSGYGGLGDSGSGTVFKLNTDGSGFDVLHYFDNTPTNGATPYGGLVQGTDGLLYGTTEWGGSANAGTVYKLNADGGGFEVLHHFGNGADNGVYPFAGLLEGADGALYGATDAGGGLGSGILFKLNKDGSGFKVLHAFDGWAEGRVDGSLIKGADGALYGTTLAWWAWGAAFRIHEDGSGFEVLHAFAGTDGAGSYGALLQGADGALHGASPSGGVFGGGTVFKLNTDGSGCGVTHSFSRTGGEAVSPRAAVLPGSDGALYSTSADGGTYEAGTVYKIGADGAGYTILHHFQDTPDNGAAPQAGLLKGSDGALYGTTQAGGASRWGTVFRMKEDGTGFAVLHSFESSQDAAPMAGLLKGSDGALYGTSYGYWTPGAVFKLQEDGGGYAVLHTFSGVDEAKPYGGLIKGSDGALYGTTAGDWASGTVFKLQEDGSQYAVLHTFTWAQGANPRAGLIKGADGALYGTTSRGGRFATGTLFKLNEDGSGFQVLRDLSEADGTSPQTSLVQGSDGALYGTASSGGSAGGYGTLFKWDTNGLSVLYTFDDVHGSAPAAPLVEVRPGVFFGTTAQGGEQRFGTLYSLSFITPPPPIGGGFLTGGGELLSPAGACAADATLSGKAIFTVASKYGKAAVPAGNLEFQLPGAHFKFRGPAYQWLIVAGAQAQCAGTGTVNGTGDYGFLLSVTDGRISGGGADGFRLKVWDNFTGAIVYDNGLGAPDDFYSVQPQPLSKGNIVIHPD